MAFKIHEFNFSNKDLKLSNKNNLIDQHTYTIITGKNGTGKSRLLASIVHKNLSKDMSNIGLLYNGDYANKVIAISNISNDKFPIKRNKDNRYYYLGTNSQSQISINKYYIFKNLLCNQNLNYLSIINTFNYLNFEPCITFNFKFTTTSYSNSTHQFNIYSEIYERYINYFEKNLPLSFNKKIKEYLKYSFNSKNDIYNNISNEILSDNISLELNFKDHASISHKYFKDKFSKDEVSFLDSLSKIYINNKKINSEDFSKLTDYIIYNNIVDSLENIDLNFYDEIRHQQLIEDLSFLLLNDIIRISNIYLYKYLDNSTVSNKIKYYDLSSGQQSLFNIFLGISSVIEDDCLICIDEPEVNLHPEWQTEFIIKLQDLFNEYYGCHFIIATHSPQIVAGLTSENGFVVDLENNITHTANDYSKKSADYQLAHIFGYPGYNNEYLIRIALTLLSKVTKQVEFNHNDINNLHILNSSKKDLPENDPVSFLIEQINALV